MKEIKFRCVETHSSTEVEFLREDQRHNCKDDDAGREGLSDIWIYLSFSIEGGINDNTSMRISKNLQFLRG